MSQATSQSAQAPQQLRARAVLVGDRVSVDRSRHADIVSTAPFAYRMDDGYVVIFRYGVIVCLGLRPGQEDQEIARYSPEMTVIEEERLAFTIEPTGEEGPTPSGIVRIATFNPAHAEVIANVLAKSVALARYEREIASVFDTIEPAARALADSGRIPRARRPLIQLIGSALLTQHRVSGRIAFAEKPDILWDHPELERLYAKLEEEYEIVERGTVVNGKMQVIGSAAETFTDLIDTYRSARLEIFIVILIFAELVIGAAELFR